MKIKPLNRYKIITVLIPIFILLLYFIRDYLIALTTLIPPCPFYSTLHLYCPACGNTRCVKALFHFDLFTALRYNVTPVLFGIFLLLAYIELATYSFGRHILLLPRKTGFYLFIIALLIAYLIVRNFIPYLTP